MTNIPLIWKIHCLSSFYHYRTCIVIFLKIILTMLQLIEEISSKMLIFSCNHTYYFKKFHYRIDDPYATYNINHIILFHFHLIILAIVMPNIFIDLISVINPHRYVSSPQLTNQILNKNLIIILPQKLRSAIHFHA